MRHINDDHETPFLLIIKGCQVVGSVLFCYGVDISQEEFFCSGHTKKTFAEAELLGNWTKD